MSRALEFFLAPPEPAPKPPESSPEGTALAASSPSWPALAASTWSSPTLTASSSSSPGALAASSSPLSPPALAAPSPSPSPPALAASPPSPVAPALAAPGRETTRRPRKRRGQRPGTSTRVAAAVPTLAAITGAAVLGRSREAEPVAAALALGLRRETRAKAATVAVIGPPLPDAPNGGGAARKLAARLEAHGLEPRVRGRLAWVRLDPSHPDLTSLAWQVALLAPPVVFAVTAPRTPGIDAALAEQDLVVLVTSEPDGPLAQAATAGLTRVAALRPLKRGLGRELSRAGIRAASPVRALLAQGGTR